MLERQSDRAAKAREMKNHRRNGGFPVLCTHGCTQPVVMQNAREPKSYPSFDIQRGAGRNRTGEWEFCRLLPYHLATAPKSLQSSAIDSSPQATPGRSA